MSERKYAGVNVCKLLREAYTYYQTLGIVPDEEDLVDYIVSAIADELGIEYDQVNVEKVKRLMRSCVWKPRRK
jgi:hypothetical protein